MPGQALLGLRNHAVPIYRSIGRRQQDNVILRGGR